MSSSGDKPPPPLWAKVATAALLLVALYLIALFLIFVTKVVFP